MDRARYDAFTDELTRRVADDDRVIGLVALGSTAATSREPDDWSDHDVWLVTRDGAAAQLRDDRSWLPDAHRVVIHFAETAHGRSAIYDDGHLVEYAVFDDGELEIAAANDYRVLIDRCDLERRMRDMADGTAAHATAHDPAGADRFGSFAAQWTIGVTRAARGELLSANHLLRGWAVRSLTSLLASVLSPEPSPDARLDDLDPHRRFELVHPSVAAELDRALQLPTLDAAAAILAVASRELMGQVDVATEAAFTALAVTLDRACAD